ncbi:MAG: serine hydrolase [bacterium]
MLFNILLSLLFKINNITLKNFDSAQNFRVERSEVKNIGVKIDAKSGIVIDADNGDMIFAKNENEVLPIASISKLISALVFLDYNHGWDEKIKIIADDYRIGGKLYVASGEVVTVRDLFYTSLVGSANNTTVALARSTGMTLEEFTGKMNEKAKELGMDNAYFEEPTGLSEKNVATAKEVAILAQAAYSNEYIKKALQTDEHIFYTVDKKRIHKIKNTDKLLGSFLNENGYEIVGAKTGYTEEAMYCLALGVENGYGQSVISVILGADTEANRFQEAKSLAWWGLTQENKKTIKQ